MRVLVFADTHQEATPRGSGDHVAVQHEAQRAEHLHFRHRAGPSENGAHALGEILNNDSLAPAQLLGEVTRQLKIGTWISSIHMRHCYVCAQAASLIARCNWGRMILGLGVSRQPVNAALGVNMQSPTVALRRYATEVAGWLRGEGPVTHLPQEPAPVPVPLYLAAMTSPMVELAGELADGVMPFMWSAAGDTE